MVRVGDELYSKVKAPSDGLLDSRFLLNLSDMGAEMTRNMRIEADAFDTDEYLHRIARFIGGQVSLGASRGAARIGAGDDSELVTGDIDAWDWDRLGEVAARHTRRAPVPEFLLGPLQVTPKHRRVTRTSRLETDAEQVAPQQLGAEDIARGENETSRLVLDIDRRLEACSGEEGICLFRFALNPESFSNSVENLFYISFLIRDGKAAIIETDDGDPLLMRSEEPTEEDRAAGLTRRQLVIELDMPTWRALIELYNGREPMIPTRKSQASTSRSRWYG